MLSPSKRLRIMHIMSIIVWMTVAVVSYPILRAFLTRRPSQAADISGTPLAQEVPA